MNTTTDRVTPALLRTLATALGGTRAGDARTLTWTDEHGRQITLHIGHGRRRTYVGVDRIDSGPRPASATAQIERIFAEHEAAYSHIGPVYAAGSVPTPLAPLVLLHLVAIETGATFTAGGTR